MKFPSVAVAVLFAAACQSAPEPGGTLYGEALTLAEITPVPVILDDPEAWVGKRVQIEGMVVQVCEMRGCWMDIASDSESEKIQIKVEDGVIVFPMTAKGKTALVEGVVEVLELTLEEAIEAARHKAEEHGEEFDPSTVTGPETTYRIRGLGAIITD
jgi:hypothetical protein